VKLKKIEVLVRSNIHKLIALNPDCLEIGGRVGQGVPAIGIAKFCAKNAFYESFASKSVFWPWIPQNRMHLRTDLIKTTNTKKQEIFVKFEEYDNIFLESFWPLLKQVTYFKTAEKLVNIVPNLNHNTV
jgi:hypothetical protein